MAEEDSFERPYGVGSAEAGAAVAVGEGLGLRGEGQGTGVEAGRCGDALTDGDCNAPGTYGVK